jgi:23S rRNA pseudouridine955/2504/2580 synthase
MHQVQTVPAGEAGDGQRLDNFLLRACKGVPKSHIYRLIRSGQVRVNGKRAKADTRLASTDLVRIPPIRLPEKAAEPSTERQQARARQGKPLPIVFEDEGLIVINKPAGTAVHGGSGISFGVIEQLRATRPQEPFLELVHRLDRETSGLLMLARRRVVLTGLHEQIRRGQIEKLYQSVVFGKVPRRDQTIKHPLRKYVSRDGERRVSIDPENGKPAVTHWRATGRVELEPGRWLSRVRVHLETGRTHQIRVHLAHQGFPILGDRKYGDFDRNRELAARGVNRMLLHAVQLQIRHPLTGERLTFGAPAPDLFSELVPDTSA